VSFFVLLSHILALHQLLSLCCNIESKEPEVDTASNSTTGESSKISSTMTDKQLTIALYQQLRSVHPVTISAKLPTQDDARAIVAAEFQDANAAWKSKGPKNAVSRYHGTLRHLLVVWF